MHFKDLMIVVLCVAVGGAFLAGASMQIDAIHTARRDMGLVIETQLENAPPSLAFATVAMGAFRGLVVNILWIRAEELKQEGKFFDAKQLAEWITTLQPRFVDVWDFHGWNMAYNISVAIPNTQPEERWRWVKNGYELLRDRAIPLNPNSISLYRSLAWIFQHKIGDISDDAHRYYKKELAESMRLLLGERPDNDYFNRLAAAPKTLDEILTEPRVAEFVRDLQRADATFGDKARLVNHYLSLRQNPARFSREVFAVIDDWRDSEALETFDVFARASKLRSEWKLDIDFMIRLNKRFGAVDINDPDATYPLNWDHPATHAIYWAALGLEVAGIPEQYQVNEKNTDRIIFHSLQQLYRRGRVVLYEEPEVGTAVYLLPDMRMFEACDQLWREIIDKYDEFEGGNPRALRGGHKNFLARAVVMFYQAGHEQKAMRVYRELQTKHEFDDQGFVRQELKVPMMTFIRNYFREELASVSLHTAMEFIVTMLQESFFRYALREDDEAAGRESMAREIYDLYQHQMGLEEAERVGLPPMDRLRYAAFMGFLEDPMYPESMQMSLIGRIQVERPDLFDRLQRQEMQFFEEFRRQQQRQQQQN